MMLLKKLLRDSKKNLFPILSIIVLSFNAVACFTGITSSNLGTVSDRKKYHEDTVLADYWIYGGFTAEQLDELRESPLVDKAQLRTEIDTDTENGNRIFLYVEYENEVSKPYITEGEEFAPESDNGIWLNSRYAEENDIAVGDEFTLKYESISITQKIRGLIMSPEYEYYKAENDTEPDFSNIGFAYMPLKAFPVEEYIRIKSSALNDGQDISSQMKMDQLVLTSDESDINEIRKLAGEKLSGSFVSVLSRSEVQGIKMLDDEIHQHEMFAYIFPAIFVVIALMIMITTMSRIINESRMQIGAMKALGIKREKIIRQYLAFSFLLSAIGCAAGLIGGPTLIGSLMGKFMALTYTMPEWSCGYSPSFFIVSAGLVAVCVFSAYMSCRKIINTPTRDILYPRAPKKVKKCIFERLPFWEKLKFSLQYNLRDMSRNKVRNLTVLVGIIGSMLLTASALGCLDTLDNMKRWNFDELQKFEYQLNFNSDVKLSDKESIRDELNGELVMNAGIELKKDSDSKTYNASITVTEGKGLYNVTDEDTKVYELKDGEIALTSVIAEKAGLKKGDSFLWKEYGKDEWISSTVGSISRSIGVQGISMLRSTYESAGGEFKPDMCVTDENAEERSYSAVKSVSSKADLEKSWDNGLQMYYVVIIVFIIMTITILFIVIYNSAVLSFNERQKEFATLKVCGIKKSILRKIMTAQNMWMTALGCLIGMPFGRIVLNYMFTSGGDSQDFAVKIYLRSYILSFICVTLFSYLINLFFARTLRKLNMPECMKANE